MTHAARLLALVALLGCSNPTDGEGGIVAIEVTVPFPARVAVGDSLQLSARALNKDNDSVAAQIVWVTPDNTITVDSASGVVTGVSAGPGRVQALSGSLASALVTVTVVEPSATSSEAVRPAR